MATKITSSSNVAATTTNIPSTSSLANKYLSNYSCLGHDNLSLFSARSPEHHHMYAKHQSSYCKTEFSLSNNLTQLNAHNSTMKLRTTTLNDEIKSKPFRLDDLVWAKLKNFPWWPCQIVRDLVDNNEYFKIIRNKEMYLVEMIGSYKERAWVTQSSLFKYKGIESFKTYAQDQVDRAETKLEKERLAERFQLKVSLTRRDEWDRAIAEADLIIKKSEQEQDFNHKKNFTLKLKRKRDNDEINMISNNEDEIEKIKYSKIDFDLNNNNSNLLKSDDLVQEEVDEEEDNDESENEDEEEEELEPTSDEDDSDSFQPTTIYDIEQPIQNIYTYNNAINNSNNTNNIHNSLKASTYSEDEYQQMHSIDSIMTELENNHIKNKTTSKTQRVSNSECSVLFNETTNNNMSCSSSIEHSNKHLQLNNELVDQSKKKKRGRKPKQMNDIENNTLLNNNTNNKSSSFNTSSSSGSTTSSNQSSPSNSRKNSADLTHNLNGKKQNKFASLADYVITQSSSSSNEGNTNFSTKNHKKNEASKSKNTFDQNQQLNELLLKDSKDFDLNLNDFINPKNTSRGEANMNNANSSSAAAETYLIDRYKYAVRHIRQGLSVEEACNKYRISKGALLKCLSGGTAPRGKKTRLTETEENEIVEWLINNKDVKYNEAIHLVFEQVEQIFQQTQRPNPFNNGKPSMDWWYDFLSRHPQIMASKPDWLRRGKVNDQYIRDVQSGQLKCTKFRRALLSAIQYIKSLTDAENAHHNGNRDDSANTGLNEKLAVKKETTTSTAKSSDFYDCNPTSDSTISCLKNNTIKSKSIKNNKLNNSSNKTDSLLTAFHQQQQQQNQIKPRQTMNSISTTIDSPSKLISNKKPEFLNTSRSGGPTTNGSKTDNLIENTSDLVDYTEDDLDSITNILERSTHGKLDSSNLAVRFDNFLNADHHHHSHHHDPHHQNLLITDDLSQTNGFVYDTASTATNGIQNQDSSIFLNDHYNSIHDEDEQTDDDEFDDQRTASSTYIEIDPSRFI